jgi:hypothetical protein
MRDIQALGDWNENRNLLTGDNSGEQLVFTQYPAGPIVFIGGQGEYPGA